MSSKKDIYNLWVQYTTKNEEYYFRQFIERFVEIWKEQLTIDFTSESCPLWFEVSSDNGPHLGRLPDELLPAIGKFIIIARDTSENEELSEESTRQIAVLVDCLIIVCRNFENILAVIKYEYKSNLIAILTCLFKQCIERKHASIEAIHLFRSFSQFLEVLYDPYLTWRSFLRGIFAEYNKLSYKPHTVHPEIVPFIYDCFQSDEIRHFPAISESLISSLGAVICGSQKCISSLKTTINVGEGIDICDNVRNGMRAICPATVSILMEILSLWDTPSELRSIALSCCALMVIVLQKSSPCERQIDLVTVIKFYSDVILKLLKTDQFNGDGGTFEIANDSDSGDVVLDVNALSSTLYNVKLFLADPVTAYVICESIGDTNLVDILITVPQRIAKWNMNYSSVLCSTIESLTAITRSSKPFAEHMRTLKKCDNFFKNLKSLGLPSEELLDKCFHLAFDDRMKLLILPDVIVNLIDWIPEMNEREQTYLSRLILEGCTANFNTKSAACQNCIIKTVCNCLQNYHRLSELCIQQLIKLIEDLTKLSLDPIELKSIFKLLRLGENFPQHKQLHRALVTISLQSLTSRQLCTQYFALRAKNDGIIVADIKNWTMSGSYGFIFHIIVQLNENPSKKKVSNGTHAKTLQEKESSGRRMLLNLRTKNNTGFEVFIQNNGNIVVAALTKREYLTCSAYSKVLLDGGWHYLTIAVTPPKRPFSYSQINVYVDYLQKLSATLKVEAISEPFIFCSIGSAAVPKNSETTIGDSANSTQMQETSHSYRGMLPSLLERTLSSNVSNYFTLPLRTQSNYDPNVKNFPIGMQDTVFGEPLCLKGNLGPILMAESSTNLKTIFDAGQHFASLFSQDNDLVELTSRFVFCYAPEAFWNNICQDLIPSGRFPGIVQAQHCRLIKIQNAINSIGGIQAILPILHSIIESQSEFQLSSLDNDMPSTSTKESLQPSPVEFSDWEMLPSTLYTEWKMIQFPVASFMCLLRYIIYENDSNHENLYINMCLPIIGNMLQKCPPSFFDVNALMATHLLMESIQGHKIQSGNEDRSINAALLEDLYTEIIFNFEIWEHMHFQITLGHVQYLSTMIKNDRKTFRKKFGVQFFLDIVRKYYGVPNSILPEDVKAIRGTLFSIVRFYLQKDVNINEISAIVAFLASVRQAHLLIEFLEMLTFYVKGKNCQDQMILLMHEPQTANLLYNYFVDKSYSSGVQDAAVRFLSSLLRTSRVQQKYKQILRLQDQGIHSSMFPGFFSYLIPMTLSSTTLFHLLDEMLNAEPDYSGIIYLVHHVSLCELHVKLEIAKRLLQTTFVKPNSTQAIAQQTGWQESIARMLIRKPIDDIKPDDTRRRSFGINLDVLLEENNEFVNISDLISFSEEQNELDGIETVCEDQGEGGLILNEIQASVTEAANAIESEIKELAESVSGAVVENVSSVFSVIRQTTHDLQDTFESLALGGSELDLTLSSQRSGSISSDSSTQSHHTKKDATIESSADFKIPSDNDSDNEEQLVYLVSNILFNIFWRGVSNDDPQCWKERGQVLGCINLLALNNELITSHLSLRLRILEMAVQASLFDLSEHGNQTHINQENASQILRMVYDLIVLGTNEDDTKKCSTKLLDGVLGLLDVLMVFQNGSDDWSDMIRLSLGVLLKCAHHSNPGVVAMATAKLHSILQNRNTEDLNELSYLLFSINKALDNAIEVGNSEEYCFLMPVMKALLEKCRFVFNLSANLPDLPPTSSGPVFFNDFQMYSTSKRWSNFIEKNVKPLYDTYQHEIEINLWEPINRYWAECYEACKAASKKRAAFQVENRRHFQQKIVIPWKMRQVEEITRLNASVLKQKTKTSHIKQKWEISKRFINGPRGPWFVGESPEEFWALSNHENVARMRLKLEPQIYPNKHEDAANLRDNATNLNDRKEISEFDSTIKNAVVRDFLIDDENAQLEDELRQSVEAQVQHDVHLEKSIISHDCELITLMTKVKGKIEVNQTMFKFVDLSPSSENSFKHDFGFSVSKIREVHLRKYNLRRSALEIFLVDQMSYFLNFTTKTRNKVFTKILSLQPPNILYGSGRSPAELLRNSGHTQKWINREISNFEYLMHLNTIAGRSYNDLSQYPVFPWILADYTSDVLDLTDPKSFRNLSKPIGVINAKNEAEVRSKYDSFEDPSGDIPKFHYGTHYSNSAGVLHYLMRVEPFTSLHIELQSGRFDVADRQFHSIPQTWKLLMDNPNDVKELIPEFFYFPEFLKNLNKLDLGHLQITKEKVDDVILPPWATTPEEFIAIHRRALESEYVSKNLHNWIDLIFGYKQKGPNAAKALNVFYYCSYEGAVDLDKITNPIEREAVEGMINNFGQVPSQLLREPHPSRLTQEETTLKLLRAELKRPDFTQFLDKIVQYYCEFSTPKDPIIFLSPPRSPPRSFLQLNPDVLISITKSCIIGQNSWMSFDKDKGFLLEIDATTTNIKNRRRLFGPLHPSQVAHPNIFAVSTDGKLLYVGGIWDNSLRVYNVHKGKTVASITRHLDIITCLALDNCGSYLVTGSRDCTCIIWSIQNHQYSSQASNIPAHVFSGQVNLQLVQNNFSPKALKTLYGHDNAISCCAVYTELDMVISGSLDGTVNVYTIQEGQFLRTLKPIGCTELCVQISYIAVSYHGHIAFSALDDTSHSVHVYSINGTSLGSKYVSGRVTGLATASDYLVVADDAGDITVSRLNGLKPVVDIPLHIPIQTIVLTPGNTHILAPLRDGRVAVIAVQNYLSGSAKKHSILNV